MTSFVEYLTTPSESDAAAFAVGVPSSQKRFGPAPLVTTANRVARPAAEPGHFVRSDLQQRVAEAAAKALQNKQARRLTQYKARGVLHSLSSLSRVRDCGAVSVRPHGTTDLMHEVNDGVPSAYYSGLATCGSVWACPVCSEGIQSERRGQVEKLLSAADLHGYSAVFGTMTLRHRKSQRLALTWGALSAAFKAVAQDKTVRRLREELGHFGYLRIVEVTHSPANGWHPHIHTLSLFAKMPSELQLEQLGDAEFRVWERVAKSEGLGKPLRERYQLKPVKAEVSEYFSKSVYTEGISRKSVAFEVQGASNKQGYQGSRTSFEILSDLVEHRRPEDLKLWHEFEEVSRGKRALTWSRGLKSWAGIGEAEEEEPGEGVYEPPRPVVTVLGRRALRNKGVAAGGALSLVERGNSAEQVREWFADWGVETIDPQDPRAVEDRRAVARLEFEYEVFSFDDDMQDDAQAGCEVELLDVLAESLARQSYRAPVTEQIRERHEAAAALQEQFELIGRQAAAGAKPAGPSS